MIRHILEAQFPRKPWLVAGKGPSLRHFKMEWCKEFNVATINQVATLIPGQIAMFIDYEPFIESAPYLSVHGNKVVMPWVPHWREKPNSGTLETYLKFDSSLCALEQADRLCSFDLRTTQESPRWPAMSVIQAFNSTSEAVIHILALMGERKIYTIGIDGGMARAAQFQKSYRTYDVNYDGQFAHIEGLSKTYGLSIIKR